MKKFLYIIFLLVFIIYPIICLAQENQIVNDEIFRAKVIEVIDEQNITLESGSTVIQQKLKLKGLNGEWTDKEFIFDGTQYEVLSAMRYKIGDKVVVNQTTDIEGNDIFFVIDYVRQSKIYWLALIFALLVILVGRLKGLRALVVLVLTFIIILYFIIPKILTGSNPLLISIIGSLAILILAIYITEGFKKTSTIAIIAIFFSLIITGLLSVWFTTLTRLTGFASEEAVYLIGLSGNSLNIQGLLLAGIIIGALGVLDDVVISQVTLVRELKDANPHLSKKSVYIQAMKVGISHMSAMVNTLFLAYAGASLPLLILFSIKQPPFLTFNQVLNNEVIATEIVRTLTGSIGLILAIPIATFLAVSFIKITKKHN